MQTLSRARQPCHLAELANAVQMTSAQVFTYMVTLCKLALVKRTQFGAYEPGPLALRLGLRHLQQQLPYRVALSHVQALAAEIGHSVAVCIMGPQGPTIVRYENSGLPLHVNLHVGTVMSLSQTSTGRVFSAYLPAQIVRQLMQQQAVSAQNIWQQFYQSPAPHADALQHDADAIRARGMARGINYPSPGISSLCIPVFDAERQLCLALTVVGSSKTMDTHWHGSIAKALRTTAKAIEEALSQPLIQAPQVEELKAIAATENTKINTDKQQRGIQSLEITGQLLQVISSAMMPLSLRTLSANAQMSSAKAFPHLVSLCKIGLLERHAQSGDFSPGALSLELGLNALQRLAPVREAEQETNQLVESTGLTVALAIIGPMGPTIIHLEDAPKPMHISIRIGTVMSMMHTTIGRVFSAYLPAPVLERLLHQNTLRFADETSSTVISKKMADTLRKIRISGIDSAIDKPVPGIHALAAPVFDYTGNISLVLAVMGPADSFDVSHDGAIAQTLKESTTALSYRLGYMA
ncbi:IclR family transcriptional regulator domain-containing protein [Collimonas antrihumi]|uniref:IclR family transcriptional regulator n=1 Tax=Collimonas antrihumi TaxID=1940615 RepID=UPI001FE7A043